MLLSWRWYPAACAVAAGLLLRMGAPVVPVVLGLVVAAAAIWRSRIQ